MIEAVTEVTARAGYADASVADIIATAGVSRKTFYEHFRDKEECFLTAYDVLSKRLIRALVAVGEPYSSGARRRRAQVLAFLGVLAKNPPSARVFVVDVLGAGPRALRRRERVNERFANAILGDAAPDPVRRKAIVGGVNNVVAGALMEARPALLALAPSLSEFVERALRK